MHAKKHKSTHIQLTNDLSLNGSGAEKGRGNGSWWSDGGGRQVAPVVSAERSPWRSTETGKEAGLNRNERTEFSTRRD